MYICMYKSLLTSIDDSVVLMVMMMMVMATTAVLQVILPGGILMSGTALEGKGILVQSDQEIVVFGVNSEKYTTDAYLAMPVCI